MTEATRTAPERKRDLVEQLRWEARYAATEGDYDGDLVPENTYQWAAADEIERLHQRYEEAITALQKLDRELTREFGEPSPPLDGVDEAQIAAHDLLHRHGAATGEVNE